MRIPFANRTADVDLPAVPGQPKVTVKAVIDAFRDQVPNNFEALFEAFVLLSPRKVRVTCRTSRALEDVCHLGLSFRDSPVIFHPCRSAKWVNITRLSYGVPNEAILAALSPFGKVHNIKMDTYKGVYVGVRNVLMDISTPIPSSLKIAEHWCNLFYPGQTPTCFACRKVGHSRANCPEARDPLAPAIDAAAGVDPPILLSPARNDLMRQLVDSVVDRVAPHFPAAPPAPYAAAVRTGLDADPNTAGDRFINDDGLVGPKIADVGHVPDLPRADLNLTDVGLGGPQTIDDGPQLAVVSASGDSKINDVAPPGPPLHDDPTITDADHPGPKITDVGHPLAITGAVGDPKINDADLDGPKINDDGHTLVIPGDVGDPKINDADLDGPKIADEGHRDTSVLTSPDSQDTSSEDDFLDEGHSSALVIDTDAIDADDDASDGGMEVTTETFKRERSDDSSSDSSDGSPLRHRKKGKAIEHALSHLLTVATATPIPDDDDERSPDLISDPPVNPDNVAEPSLSVDTDCTDYPLTQATPIVKPSVPKASASQSSSSGLDMFLSQRTQPQPVVGTHVVLAPRHGGTLLNNFSFL